jgi:membrane-associated phospholipid phosphatase
MYNRPRGADFVWVLHCCSIAQEVAIQQRNTLEENARLFALLNMALADAAIVSWDCKYTFNFWGPITAIREADSDGNAATTPDSNWTPLLPTPPFPEFTSGHSTFSGAAAVVLASFYGRDDVAFSVESDDLAGKRRFYPGFAAAAIESGISRIYGGIHFMSANLYGLSSGGSIGEYVVSHALLPKGNRSRR